MRLDSGCDAEDMRPKDITLPSIVEDSAPKGVTKRTLAWFFSLTFLLGWGVPALALVFAEQMEAIFGELSGTHPVFIFAVYSPAIAAIYLVWRHYGREGLASYFRRVTLWRMPGVWWLFLILGVPAIKYVGAALNGVATVFPFDPWYAVLPAMGVALVIGPIEEFGWRGFGLPLLQCRFRPLWASLILGAFWGLWHLPAFLLSGTPQSAWSFGPFFLAALALSVVMTPMFNASSGSILVAALFHFQLNGPAWPDAQPWENYLMVLVAVVVVFLNRKAMWTGEGAVTEVLMPEGAGSMHPCQPN